MWILPRNLPTSVFAPDTVALISDSSEQSQACAQSLLVRSKPMPARTWLRKWKRDSWTRHLSGRILKPSHGEHFTGAWTSSLAATPASHLVPPASGSAQTTPATSGPLLLPGFDSCSPDSVSLRTSKDTSALGSEQSLKNWQNSVTQRRGAYLARVKLALLTRESGCSFSPKGVNWPTPDLAPDAPNLNSNKRNTPKSFKEAINWPTVSASEDAAGTPDGKMQWMLSQAARTGCSTRADYQAQGSAWPTPQARDFKDTAGDKTERNTLNLGRAVHGRPAPANPSTDGSRQESWATPRSCSAIAATITRESATAANRFPNLETQVGRQAWGTPRTGMAQAGRRLDAKKSTLEAQIGCEGRKLNPRWVETLMGLPVGWTMASCASPVTIAPMNSACLATA